ncbi:TetR/AcrR family transcriptional regulator [Bacillus shivajii]|uniref:TetR/AcrR family transcriptional regulator n=1 Tax=Bacillus shivajii TaxID=1983719 RepID=UPI001CFC3E87|nr:TetR/AcrR family transcriptional regulator [Bacillus shivajii]UCZ53531.1 TetR/AcrR family transcriptional regulator [Bacillus shivajii]
MRDKTEQIIHAALDVFLKRGYNQATTQEIASEANVAEVTLFRKFTNKQNLFKTVIKSMIEKHFQNKLLAYGDTEDSRLFFERILMDRLEMVSKNRKIVQRLIAESFMGNLDEEVNFPKIISASLRSAIDTHFSRKDQKVDVEQCTRLLAGILLSHVFFEDENDFQAMSDEEKQRKVDQYVRSLMIFVE